MNEKYTILDEYIIKEPSDQNVLDIFKGEWSSKLPDNSNLIALPGSAVLFEDARIDWVQQQFGGFENKTILELGPLEGGHSYMLQQKGAKNIVSIEANTRAFMKCLIIKEVFCLDKVSFKLGDFMTFMRKEPVKFDVVIASGVLYHMENPIELLQLISKVTNNVFIWTHYYDREGITSNPNLNHKFSSVMELYYEGENYEYSNQYYKEALGWAGFCGGPTTKSIWLTKQSILKALSNFGFVKVSINFDHTNHPNGPSFGICASK